MYFVEKTKAPNPLQLFDYFLFLSILIISIIGIVVLSSATANTADGPTVFTKQIIFLIIGVAASILIGVVDYKVFKSFALIFYLLSLGLLVVVLFIGTGQSEWGATSWLQVPIIGTFQPSELAKIATILLASIYFEKIKEGEPTTKNTIKILLVFALPLLLLIKQPDYGTAMVFVFILILLAFVAGIKYRYIIVSVLVSVPIITFIWVFMLNQTRKNRFLVFLNPDLDPLGAGYHIKQLIKAIGSGKIFGKGLYQGIQTQLGGIPERDTDSIFAVVGEELGFVFTCLVVVLFIGVLIRTIYIAKKSREPYGSFVAIGIAGMLGFHFIENVGMSLGLLPLTGIPLPFISAGGSAMLTNFIAFGILLSISVRRKKSKYLTE